MQKLNWQFILKSFLIWRIAITLVAVVAIKYIPLAGINFFGGKFINYITNPLFYGWANFDGEHYLSIAMFGYKDLQLAFFPAYPFLMKLFTIITGSSLSSYVWSGIIVSNILFLLSLVLLWIVVRLDYSERVAKIVTILTLVFPTSFYFGAVYTESLFLFGSLLTYYLYRKNMYLLSGFVGILMTLTRLYGVFILVMVVIDVINNKKDLLQIFKEKIYLVFLSITGILSFMWFSFVSKGDPLAFYSLQTNVGEQRSDHLIMLPQVFYRYFVKIIPNLQWSYFPIVFSTLLELLVALLFLYLIIVGFKKIRWDYWVYLVLGYIVPTLTGSFSSFPRYVLVLFPAYVITARLLENKNKYLRLGIYIALSIIGILAQSLFIRGYWIS